MFNYNYFDDDINNILTTLIIIYYIIDNINYKLLKEEKSFQSK